MGRRRDGGDSPTQRSDIDRMLDRWERAPEPLQLPYVLVETTGPRRECEPVPVQAAVPVHYSYVETIVADGEVIAYTDRAVLVRAALKGQYGETGQREFWVWANAVTRK